MIGFRFSLNPYIYFSGRILTGVVRKQKMQRTIIIRRDYLHFVKKYGRFEKRHNVSYHILQTRFVPILSRYYYIETMEISALNNALLSEHGRPYVTSFLGC